MTRWTRASLGLVGIVLGTGCGGEIAPPGPGHATPTGGGSENGALGPFGAAALGQGAGADAGATVTGPGPFPGLIGSSGGAPPGSGSIGTGSSGAGSDALPPKSQASVVTLAAGQTCPWGMAIDATSVYWTDCGDPTGGNVLKVPKVGGPVVALASGDRLSGIAVDDGNVYWVAGTSEGASGTIMKVPVDGGTPTTLASRPGAPAHVAVDASSVYWIEQMPGAVMKMPRSGGDPVMLASASFGWEIALGETDVFWLGQGLMKVAKAGGTAVSLTSSAFPTLPTQGLAVNATSVYFTSGPPAGTSGVSEIAEGGGTTDVVYASTQSSNGGPIAIDATRAYWADGSNSVYAVRLAGGPATTLAIDQNNVVAIAVDATRVYWLVNGNASTGQGAVMALPLAAIDDGGP